MPVLDKSKLAEVQRQFRAIFMSALGQAPRWSLMGPTAIAQRIPVTGSELKPKFGARASGVQEWLDERQYSGIRVFDFSVPVKHYANGLKLNIDDLEDDQSSPISLYADQVADLADDFEEHKHQQIIDLLVNGFAATSGTAYDGQFFFDTDHADGPDGPSGQRNVRAGLAFDSAGLYQALADMAVIKKPNGKNANLRATHGIFPEALRGTVESVLSVQYLASGASNPHYNRITPIYDGRLDQAGFTTGWFLADLSKSQKPIIHADRKSVGFMKSSPTDETAMDSNVMKWGADGRYNSGYGLWQLIWGSDGP